MGLSGSNVLITGASSGLGLAVSKRFARLGANTILSCRNEQLGDAAVLEPSELARTGTDATPVLMWGVAFTLLGALLIVGTRRFGHREA